MPDVGKRQSQHRKPPRHIYEESQSIELRRKEHEREPRRSSLRSCKAINNRESPQSEEDDDSDEVGTTSSYATTRSPSSRSQSARWSYSDLTGAASAERDGAGGTGGTGGARTR